MDKFKIITSWLVVVAVLISSLSFVGKKQEAVPCRQVTIKVLDSLDNGFITKNYIQKILKNVYPDILGSPLSLINTDILEKEVLKNRAVKSCDIFNSSDGTLYVEILQRQPILRIINYQNVSYYIDHEGFLIPFSAVQSPNVLVATGNIQENYIPDLKKLYHVSQFDKEKKDNILKELHDFARYVYDDPFWRSQFVQIYVNKKREIELIPRVGAHIIILGNTKNYDKKLSNLMALYKREFNHSGWNEYETINLKFKNQVICSKR